MSGRGRKSSDYEVGYGRPPIATRFAVGNRANPNGRPRDRTGPHSWDQGSLNLRCNLSPAVVLQVSSRFLLLLLWVCGQRVCVVQAKRHIHSPRRHLDFVHAGAPHRHRHLVVHRLVRAPKIVEVHPGTDAGPRLAAIGVGFQMHFFVLDRAPQPFDENVVHEAAASVHRNRDAGRHKLAGESLGGESGALIGIENPRPSEPKQRLLQRRRAEARIVGVRQPPCQNRPAGQSMIATR